MKIKGARLRKYQPIASYKTEKDDVYSQKKPPAVLRACKVLF